MGSFLLTTQAVAAPNLAGTAVAPKARAASKANAAANPPRARQVPPPHASETVRQACAQNRFSL